MTESDGHGVSRDTNMAAVDEHVAMRAIISRALSGGRLTQFIAHSSSASTAAAASAATNRRPSTVLVVCRCTRHESWRYMVASLSNSVLFSSCCTDRPPRRSLSLSALTRLSLNINTGKKPLAGTSQNNRACIAFLVHCRYLQCILSLSVCETQRMQSTSLLDRLI